MMLVFVVGFLAPVDWVAWRAFEEESSHVAIGSLSAPVSEDALYSNSKLVDGGPPEGLIDELGEVEGDGEMLDDVLLEGL